MKTQMLLLLCLLLLPLRAMPQEPKASSTTTAEWPRGTATPAEDCGACHQAIFREFQYGFGADLKFKGIVYQSPKERLLTLPGNVASGATAHSVGGVDPFPIHARAVEEEGRSCNVCHYPQPFAIPPLDTAEIVKPVSRAKGEEAGGLTCASCHLTPEGTIRGPYAVDAPHATVADPAMHTSAICAYCHALGTRVVGKQTQTFLEWRDDFNKPGLGSQQCQDCHMPRTQRKTAEDFDVPVRAVARHLWTGGHSSQRLESALGFVVVQPAEGRAALELHVINLGAGHSVPTGSNRRGLYLRVKITDAAGKRQAKNEWLFAPWYGNRSDDRKFLKDDETRPDRVAAMQADAQGPHESSIRAGEERILQWAPRLKPGRYVVDATLVYDLNRYNDPAFIEDQTIVARRSLKMVVGR